MQQCDACTERNTQRGTHADCDRQTIHKPCCNAKPNADGDFVSGAEHAAKCFGSSDD
jgi:hypothetical protein